MMAVSYPRWINPYPKTANFAPHQRTIANIVSIPYPRNTLTMVTTAVPHQYFDKNIVRLDIPLGYGMQEINELFAPITIIDATNFEIAIDSTYFSPFSIPLGAEQLAQCVPIGETNDVIYNATLNVTV